jgi:hypothetical protein
MYGRRSTDGAAFTKLRSFPNMPQTKGAHVRIMYGFWLRLA